MLTDEVSHLPVLIDGEFALFAILCGVCVLNEVQALGVPVYLSLL